MGSHHAGCELAGLGIPTSDSDSTEFSDLEPDPGPLCPVSNGKGRLGPGSVSYTHLDVYKRQL